jgi:hypothetical protein
VGRNDNPFCRTGPLGYEVHSLVKSIPRNWFVPGLLKRLQTRALGGGVSEGREVRGGGGSERASGSLGTAKTS